MLTGRSAVYVRVMFGCATDVAKSGSSPDQTQTQTRSGVHGHCRGWRAHVPTRPQHCKCKLAKLQVPSSELLAVAATQKTLGVVFHHFDHHPSQRNAWARYLAAWQAVVLSQQNISRNARLLDNLASAAGLTH